MNRKEIYEKIYAMHVIMRSLNDEDLICRWLEDGIPDGTLSVEEVEDLYSLQTDKELDEEYSNLAVLFGEIVEKAVEDGYRGWLC